MKSLRLAAGCVALLLAAATASAQQTIFLVRHAERADAAPPAGGTMTAPSTDPPLSTAGHERAAHLATMLRSANVKYIFATEFLRTRQTAAPLAQARHLETVSIPGNEPDALLTKLRGLKGSIVIVGHSNSVPDILKRLGVKEEITIAETEFDNLFVIVRPEAGEPTLVRLRY
ncbi:MAG TPA: histidine phosphatase family protein [Vicinamibacterales bacterium]|nr:histidine phosphatase family protein [Vicinamibacterales bacterium]